MKQFQEIKASELNLNPFQAIGEDWLLITAKKADGKINTMTASWGGLGVLWNKNVAYIFIRPQRYTKEFVDASGEFSITFFTREYKKDLAYLGSTSGRDEDKIGKCGYTVLEDGGVPYFAEAHTAILCKKLYAQDMTADSFLDKELISQNYPDADFHTIYVGEVQKALVKK